MHDTSLRSATTRMIPPCWREILIPITACHFVRGLMPSLCSRTIPLYCFQLGSFQRMTLFLFPHYRSLRSVAIVAISSFFVAIPFPSVATPFQLLMCVVHVYYAAATKMYRSYYPLFNKLMNVVQAFLLRPPSKYVSTARKVPSRYQPIFLK
jgi:hypothetical protein|uniref:Uncharacterized protein n=1 Tax=Picea glauca TaxID=3330 RepID=A0A124GMU3_PICGL|nr:hypothetical protein ABT39_MTgene1445 [Picea glauca]QHR92424.1 hypothetical protein Q903MT_gene6470 [Picea sitchensis]